ncbi:MAG: hypothetical protein EHM45_25005 [Desulfobacteraceae bacterium]|nr:MAG: hypothetical protein EHM45_25005 [Desulfobacteraceae bacterium]
MKKIFETAKEAIEASRSMNEITRCEHNDENLFTLDLLCDDYTVSDTETEYWAEDWRVHMVNSEVV